MKMDLLSTPSIEFLSEYLQKKGMEYELFSEGEKENDSISFNKNGITFNILADEYHTLTYGKMPAMIDGNWETLSQVKEYIHRCNMYNGMVWFDFCEYHLPKLHITCGFNKYFSEQNMKTCLVEGINMIEKMMLTFYPGIYDIVAGVGTAKEIFEVRKKLYK